MTRFLLPAVLSASWAVMIAVFVHFDHDWPVLLVWLGLLLLTMAWGVASPGRDILGPTRSRADGRRRAVALTFDDGPDPETTRAIAAMLDEAGAKGTFFCIGARAERHPEVLAELVAAGHQVGLHGFAHDWKAIVYEPWFLRDLFAADRAVADAIGAHPRWYRPPFGLIAPPVMNIRQEWDLQVAGWSVRAMDGRIDDVEQITRTVLTAEPGDVVLVHDAPPLGDPSRRPPMLAALPGILAGLQAKGLELVTMAELFGERATYRPEEVDAQRREKIRHRGIHLMVRSTAAALVLSSLWFAIRTA
jgi:peptidoglycan/xylan/chitin deacetylase (PgdA/CDA1 family)